MVARDVASYLASVPLGDPDDYAGPDLLAMWYQRKLRIYRNVLALIGFARVYRASLRRGDPEG
jgi:hypothetical protein